MERFTNNFLYKSIIEKGVGNFIGLCIVGFLGVFIIKCFNIPILTSINNVTSSHIIKTLNLSLLQNNNIGSSIKLSISYDLFYRTLKKLYKNRKFKEETDVESEFKNLKKLFKDWKKSYKDTLSYIQDNAIEKEDIKNKKSKPKIEKDLKKINKRFEKMFNKLKVCYERYYREGYSCFNHQTLSDFQRENKAVYNSLIDFYVEFEQEFKK